MGALFRLSYPTEHLNKRQAVHHLRLRKVCELAGAFFMPADIVGKESNMERRSHYSARRKLYHFLNGVWSGIPLCCIRYWCAGYSGLYRDKPDLYACEARYVRCNACADSGRVVKTRGNGIIAHWLIERRTT